MIRSLTAVTATLVLIMVAATATAQGPAQFEGRVEQVHVLGEHDADAGMIEAFLRRPDRRVIRVLIEPGTAVDPGMQLSIVGQADLPVERTGRDGVTRRFETIRAESVSVLNAPTGRWWIAVVLIPLLGAFLIVSVLVSRSRRHVPSTTGRTATSQDVEHLEAVNLPTDPAAALAALAGDEPE